MAMIPFYRPYFNIRELKEIMKVFRNFKFTKGKAVEEFESKICKISGRKYAIAVSSATAALHLLVKLNKDKGTVVITTPFSFVASANSGLYENKEIVFTKVDEKTLLMSEDSLKETLKQYVDKVCCVIYVDIFGLMPDTYKIKDVCKKYNAFLIEDASHAVGSMNKCIKATDLGDASVISFHENKQITTGGEGGVILTDNLDVCVYCKSARDQGRVLTKNWMDEMLLGYNYRMTEIQAAFGIAQVDRLTKNLTERRKIVATYEKELGRSRIELPYNPDPSGRSWFVYNTKFKNQDDLNKVKNYLDIFNVGYNPNYFPRINKLSPHKSSQFSSDFLDEYYSLSIALPLYQGLFLRKVRFICCLIKRALDLNNDSVSMYDNIGADYTQYAQKVEKYISSVDKIIDASFKKDNWLDIGSADGSRILDLTRNKNVDLLSIESSKEMVKILDSKNIKNINADISNKYTFLDKINTKFDTITCLYNVLGHIENRLLRLEALKNINKLLADDGVFLFDVNNRWNFRQYGFISGLKNFLLGIFKINSGDYILNISSNGKQIKSKVHLFNKFEVKKLLKRSGFKVEKIFYVDYKTGEVVSSMFLGQILIIAKNDKQNK